ncbi:MAG: hypothetical protein MUO67_22125, partial [Anaerolineales bacterium]|nr:hypothetical protein [Anaerolineales bacterium]
GRVRAHVRSGKDTNAPQGDTPPHPSVPCSVARRAPRCNAGVGLICGSAPSLGHGSFIGYWNSPLPTIVYRPSSVVHRLSSVVCRPSSIVQLFVPLRFKIIFYSKIFIIEPTHGASPTPNRRTMCPD